MNRSLEDSDPESSEMNRPLPALGAAWPQPKKRPLPHRMEERAGSRGLYDGSQSHETQCRAGVAPAPVGEADGGSTCSLALARLQGRRDACPALRRPWFRGARRAKDWGIRSSVLSTLASCGDEGSALPKNCAACEDSQSCAPARPSLKVIGNKSACRKNGAD